MNTNSTLTAPSDGTLTENRISGMMPDAKPTQTLKVAIVGMAPSSRLEAPFKDESWEIWSLSNCYKFIPRWTRYFELHDPSTRRDRYPELWEWLCKKHDGDKPIYVNQPCPEIQNAVVFPYEELCREFNTRYFTNQISWMIAWAIHIGAKEIGIYGVDMAQQLMGEQSEYAYQRPSCEYFIGVAAGKGIKVFVHPKSDIMKASCLYGVEGDQNQLRIKWKARLEELHQQEANHDAAHRDIGNKLWLHRGAHNAMSQCVATLQSKNAEVPEAWAKELQTLEAAMRELESKREASLCKKWLFRGAIDDMNWWSEWIYQDWAGEGPQSECSQCRNKLEQ